MSAVFDTKRTRYPICPHCATIDRTVRKIDIATLFMWKRSGHRSVCPVCGHSYEVAVDVCVWFSTLPVEDEREDS